MTFLVMGTKIGQCSSSLVTSSVLCQQKKWGSGALFKILISKDRKQNPFHTGSITKSAHGSRSSAYLHESPFNGIGGTDG